MVMSFDDIETELKALNHTLNEVQWMFSQVSHFKQDYIIREHIAWSIQNNKLREEFRLVYSAPVKNLDDCWKKLSEWKASTMIRHDELMKEMKQAFLIKRVD